MVVTAANELNNLDSSLACDNGFSAFPEAGAVVEAEAAAGVGAFLVAMTAASLFLTSAPFPGISRFGTDGVMVTEFSDKAAAYIRNAESPIS